MAKSFLQSPYFDDYDENKKFYKILFRPSIPVQARELTQIQTMLQKQVERLGKHFFKEGDKVVDGQLFVDLKITYLKLTTIDDVTPYIGKTVVGNTTGVQALIVAASNYVDENSPSSLYVKYVSGGTNESHSNEFELGEKLSIANGNNTISVTIGSNSTDMGYSSIAQVKRGVYFIYGNFVLVDDQTIILDNYSNMPTYKIGFAVEESIVTPEKDSSLYDNAIGSYNEGGPGAHRYFIDCVLSKRSITSDSSNDFIELTKIVNGEIIKISETNSEKEITEDVLARRTYDESGDYVVRQFKTDVREHRSNDRGNYSATSKYDYKKGDILNRNSIIYKAIKDNSSTPTPTSSDWEIVSNPIINDGVYNAVGRVVDIKLLKSPTYNDGVPTVSVHDGFTPPHTALAVPYLDDNNKLVKIQLISSQSGFTKSSPTIVEVDGKTDVAEAVMNYGDSEKFALTLNSGKAYVKGYEIEKVGTTVLGIDKARTTESRKDVLGYTSGNYVIVDGLKEIPKFSPDVTYDLCAEYVEYSTYPTITKNPGTALGHCNIRGISYMGGLGKDAKYKIYLSNVSITTTGKNFERNVKSLSDSSSPHSFVANIFPYKTKLSGTVTGNDTNTLTGNATSFSSELIVGDYVYIDSSTGITAKVNGITSQGKITLDRKVTCTSASCYRLSSYIKEPQNFTSLYKMTDNVISTINSITFFVQTYFSIIDITPIIKDGYRKITLTSPLKNSVFTTTDNTANYILSGNTSGFIEIKGRDDATSALSDKITLRIDQSVTDTKLRCCATLMVTLENTASKKEVDEYNKKTLKVSSLNVDNPSTVISFPVIDVKEISSIKMYDGVDYTIDVTDRYSLDNGQRDCYYELSSLNLKDTYDVPSSKIRITYKYFSRSNSVLIGSCFFVNSYESYLYDEIQSYSGSSLRNYIDFRQSYSSSTSLMLKEGEEITVNYSYYLPRRDRICLDSNGNFIDVKGLPALVPQLPEIPSMSMNLYNITIYPYTFNTSDVIIDIVDNKRYTMRDIGKMETRIKNLEDYTTLSMLEQQTSSMSITDEDGVEKYKQGFVVDNFKTTDIVSRTDKNVNCSIDTSSGILRPSYISRSLGMHELYSDRESNNYMAYGKVFTLPLDESEPHVVLVSQPIATRTENINPFAVVRFLGSMSVNPSTDDWYETEYLDDSISTVEGNYQTVYDSLNGVVSWDDWEESWTGIINTIDSDTSTSTTFSGTTGRVENGNHDYRYDYYTTSTLQTNTYSQEVGYSRTGLVTSVSLQTDYEEVGDYLISTRKSSYMRSRNLLVKAKGLKPNTVFYPFFDNVDISNWCTPATVIQYIPYSSSDVFDCTSLSKTITSAREIETITKSLWEESTDKSCLDVGDVITGNSSGATAVVVGKSVDMSDVVHGNKYYLYVVNVKKGDNSYFNVGETFNGSISGATGTLVSLNGYTNSLETIDQNKHHGDKIITNRNGDAQFIFWIPDANRIDISKLQSSDGYIKFKCGDRIISVNDNKDNNNLTSNSRAEVTYSAAGIINTRQKSKNAVRNAKIVTESVNQDKTVTNTWSSTSLIGSTTTSQYVYLDPLAQTFAVECEGGCFISKVDVYFASKDDSIPVTMEIRTVSNGYPSNEVLAFGECTLKPEDVKISSNNLTYLDEDGVSVSMPGFDVPTTFTFESPVYVENGQEYAIVLKTDSTNYRVWISQIGQTVPGQDYVVSNQPYLGVLFKSQNASTWSAEQNQDLMFTVYRANFRKDVVANIGFETNTVPRSSLNSSPFQTTKDSSTVVVWHNNHGFKDGDKVKFFNSDPNMINVGNNISGTITTSEEDETYTKLSGKITVTTGEGSDIVIGSSTTFLTQVKVDDILYIKDETENKILGVVKSIDTNTKLYLKSASPYSLSNADFGIYVEKRQIATGTNTSFTSEVNVLDAIYKKEEDSIKVVGIVKSVLSDTSLIFEYSDSFVPYSNIIAYREVSINGILPSDIFNKEFEVYNVESTNYRISVTGSLPTKTGYAGGNYIKASQNYTFDIMRPNITSQNFSNTEISYTYVDKNLNNSALIVNGNNELLNPITLYSPDNVEVGEESSLKVHCTFKTNNKSLSPVVDSDRVSLVLISNLINDPAPLGGENPISNYITKEINLTNTANYLKVAFELKVSSPSSVEVYYKSYLRSSSNASSETWKEMNCDSNITSSSDYQDASYSVGGTDDFNAFDTFAVKIVMLGSNTSNVPLIKNLRMIACI